MADTPYLHVRCRADIGTLPVDVDLTLASPWTVLFGPSGSGKSSLLRLIAGAWMPAESSVRFRGDDLSRSPIHLRRIGLVAQQTALFPHLHVLDNVRFGCTQTTREEADAMMEAFELAGLRHARVEALSGGERQRVALARALAAAPQMLLLDEVFIGMHLHQRNDLLRRVQAHCAERDIPVLSVTHDAIEASLIAGEVIRLEAGRVSDRGKAEDVLANERELLRHALARTPSLQSEIAE